jgi:hypothetical protein
MTWESKVPFTYLDANGTEKPIVLTQATDKGETTTSSTVWDSSGSGSQYGSNHEGNGTAGNAGGGAGIDPPVIEHITDIYLREEDYDVIYTEDGEPLEMG